MGALRGSLGVAVRATEALAVRDGGTGNGSEPLDDGVEVRGTPVLSGGLALGPDDGDLPGRASPAGIGTPPDRSALRTSMDTFWLTRLCCAY
jgi:hypothetical protein